MVAQVHGLAILAGQGHHWRGAGIRSSHLPDDVGVGGVEEGEGAEAAHRHLAHRGRHLAQRAVLKLVDRQTVTEHGLGLAPGTPRQRRWRQTL